MRGPGWLAWLVVGMGVAFLGAGLGTTYGLALRPMSRAQAATSWSEATCHVTRAEIESRRGKKSRWLYEAEIEYEYEASGRRYTGSRIAFTPPVSTSDQRDAAAIVARYPVGAETPCWYDPADPGSVTLSRKVAGGFWFAFPLPFLIAGFFIFRLGTRLARQRRAGFPTSDGRVRYERRGGGIPELAATATIIAVCGLTAHHALAQDLAYVGPIALALAVVAATWFAHELRCALSVVTIVAPAEIERDTDVRIEHTVRTPFGAPPITAAAELVEMRRHGTTTSWQTIKTIVVADGVLRIDGPATVAERGHGLDWELELRAHLPYGPDLYVRAPIRVR